MITYPTGANIKEAMLINEQGKLPDIAYLPDSERFFDFSSRISDNVG